MKLSELKETVEKLEKYAQKVEGEEIEVRFSLGSLNEKKFLEISEVGLAGVRNKEKDKGEILYIEFQPYIPGLEALLKERPELANLLAGKVEGHA